MRVLVAAPHAALDAAVRAITAAANVAAADCVPFAHDRSRDPTIELPHHAFLLRPDWVVLVDPRREDPNTLDAVRCFGARVLLVFDHELGSGESAASARRRWLAHAADTVVAFGSRAAAGATDRGGRAARVAGDAWGSTAVVAAFAAVLKATP